MNPQLIPSVALDVTEPTTHVLHAIAGDSGDVITVAMKALGICQTDRRYLMGSKGGCLTGLGLPILGHEGGGYILDPGPLIDGFKPGEMVVVLPHRTCGNCEACSKGLPNLCQVLEHLGLHLPGTFTEIGTFPAACVRSVGEHFPAEALPLVEPLACVIRAFARAGVSWIAVLSSPNPRLTVYGLGPMGCLIAQYGKRMCPHLKVVGVDPDRRRRMLALRLGLLDDVTEDSPASPAPLSFVASSALAASSTAIAAAPDGGTVVLFAGINSEELNGSMSSGVANHWEHIHRQELDVVETVQTREVRLVGTSGYIPHTVTRSIAELRHHYLHYSMLQNVVIQGLDAKRARYRAPIPKTMEFPIPAVEAFLAPQGIHDPNYGEAIADSLKVLIKL